MLATEGAGPPRATRGDGREAAPAPPAPGVWLEHGVPRSLGGRDGGGWRCLGPFQARSQSSGSPRRLPWEPPRRLMSAPGAEVVPGAPPRGGRPLRGASPGPLHQRWKRLLIVTKPPRSN